MKDCCRKADPMYFEVKGGKLIRVKAECPACGRRIKRAPLPSDQDRALMLAFV
ncbi:MAG: hypothetical protein AAB791_00645 [Patescibacteria group bacterium]